MVSTKVLTSQKGWGKLQVSYRIPHLYLLLCTKFESKIRFVFLEQDGESIAETLKTYETKVQQLEKDLFFYKKTSRELKKKLKELIGDSIHHTLIQSKFTNIRIRSHYHSHQ